MTVPLADSNSLPDAEVNRYRAVSPLAVAALALGILSPLAFIGPVLWLIPLLSVVVALVALWKISLSDGELAGWNIALLGLLLALLFGAAAPVHTLTRRHWLDTRAERFAKQFLDLLQQGRPQAAYQLVLFPSVRKALDVDLSADFAKDASAQKKYEHFLRLEPAQTLLAQRGQARVEHLETRWLSSDEASDQFEVRCRITHQQNGAIVPLTVQLGLLRFIDRKTGREQWRIESSDVTE